MLTSFQKISSRKLDQLLADTVSARNRIAEWLEKSLARNDFEMSDRLKPILDSYEAQLETIYSEFERRKIP